MRRRRNKNQEAELDITSFMNLMIILVPVLLMSMVFSHITVLDLKLPDLASDSTPSNDDEKENKILEVVIRSDSMQINYPAGRPFSRIPMIKDEESGDMVYDFKQLSKTLQQVKRALKEKDIDKKDILILSQPDTDYQTIVKTMDTVRSYKAVLITDVVNAELFPQISLGDAPQPRKGVKK